MEGWLNCDIADSDFNVDLAASPLPFSDQSFSYVVAQHLIEHLEYDPTLLELLKELHRILRPGGCIWLSCPDLEAVCNAYARDKGYEIDEGRKRHWPHANAEGFPVQHRINFLFHQWGEHRNLLDFEMIDWALRYAGFAEVRRTSEREFLELHPEFPARENESTSLIVRATRL